MADEKKEFVFETLPGYDENDVAQAAVALGIIIILSIGVYVAVVVKLWHKETNDLSDYLTARDSASWLAVGFSMFASAVGSWVISSPASLAYYGGILACFAYAFATGIPIILTAFWGTNIRAKFPDILSFSDFTYQKFGRVTQVLTILLSLLNMGVFATAEYTTIYGIYKNFVGLGDLALIVILILAVTTLSYTTYGGLPVSIITDKAQGVAAVFLSTLICIYVAATFNEEDISEALSAANESANFDFNDFTKGYSLTGYSNLFTLPISLVAATIFSEAFWQRAWAAKDPVALKKGAVLGFFLVFFVVGTFGALGVLISYSGMFLTDAEYIAGPIPFRAFVDELPQPALIKSGWGLLTVLLGTIMATSAVDSLQNALGASISGAVGAYMEEKNALKLARVLVVVLNIPLIAVGIQEYQILSLFLLGNMLTLCAAFPIFLGFYPEVDFLNRNLKDWTIPVGFVINFITVGVYEVVKPTNPFFEYELEGLERSFTDSIKFCFWENAFYRYPPFLVVLVASFISTALLLGLNEVLAKAGFNNKFVGHPEETDDSKVAVDMDGVKVTSV